eukprot:Rhum_TRINITY_DN14912_c7_g1::Rhum_TRINITY_DN14912_c7_g1_i7::g.128243::m.128243
MLQLKEVRGLRRRRRRRLHDHVLRQRQVVELAGERRRLRRLLPQLLLRGRQLRAKRLLSAAVARRGVGSAVGNRRYVLGHRCQRVLEILRQRRKLLVLRRKRSLEFSHARVGDDEVVLGGVSLGGIGVHHGDDGVNRAGSLLRHSKRSLEVRSECCDLLVLRSKRRLQLRHLHAKLRRSGVARSLARSLALRFTLQRFRGSKRVLEILRQRRKLLVLRRKCSLEFGHARRCPSRLRSGAGRVAKLHAVSVFSVVRHRQDGHRALRVRLLFPRRGCVFVDGLGSERQSLQACQGGRRAGADQLVRRQHSVRRANRAIESLRRLGSVASGHPSRSRAFSRSILRNRSLAGRCRRRNLCKSCLQLLRQLKCLLLLCRRKRTRSIELCSAGISRLYRFLGRRKRVL